MEDTSISNIFPGLDAATEHELRAAETNWGKEFIEGTGNTLLNINTSLNFAPNIPNLVTAATSYVTQDVMSYLTNAITDMLSIDTSYIFSLAAQMMPDFLISPSKILKDLLIPSEIQTDSLFKLDETAIINTLNKKIGYQIDKISYTVNNAILPLEKKIEKIGYYAHMGPEWVSEHLRLETNNVIDYCHNAISSVTQSTKHNIQKQMNEFAYNIAVRQAQKINNKIKEEQNKKLQDIELAKSKAKIKVWEAKESAITKIKKLLGA